MELDNQQRRPEEKLSWLGGIIDGEGMITAKVRVAGKSWGPLISITNTDPIIIDEVIDIFKQLKFPYYLQTKEYKISSGGKGIKFEILVSGIKRCLIVLPVIMPFLIGKKERAKALLEWCQYRLNVPKRMYGEYDYAMLIRIRKTPPVRSTTTRENIKFELLKNSI